MRRRAFITLLSGAAVVWPMTARAQQPSAIARVGFLGPTSPTGMAGRIEALRAGLHDLGYAEGQNLFIEFRWAEGKYERLDELAAELVRLDVNVIVTHTTPGTLAAKRATTTIPIVMVSGDALAGGLIASLARPGGNVTGSTFLSTDLHAKRLEILKDAMPSVGRVAVLLNPDNALSEPVFQAGMRAAAALQLRLQRQDIRAPMDLEQAFATMAKTHIEAVLMNEDAVIVANIKSIADHALRRGIASVGGDDLVTADGLIGYSPDLPDLFRHAALFVDKLLKGAKASELPVEIPTKFRLVINLKTAKTLGLSIPPTLLARANEVIE